MGNECSKLKCHRRNRREEPTQQGTELEELPPVRTPPQWRTGGTQGSRGFRDISAYAPERQTQTVGQQSTPREVAPTDFNNYMRVDRIQIGRNGLINETHEAGHSFLVEFTVTNTTSDYLRFTDTPAVVWREIKTKEEKIGGTEPTSLDCDMYAQNPKSKTFFFWQSGWKETIEPNETKTIVIHDAPSLNLYPGKDGQPRTISRRLDFEVSVPGNGPTWKATQNIKVVNGEVQNITFQEN